MRGYTLFLLLVGSVSLAWAQHTLKPGRYSLEVVTQIPNVPDPITERATDCVGPDDVIDVRSLLTAQSGEDDGCVYSSIVTAGDTLTWKTTCDDVTAATELSYVTDGFDAVVRTTADGQIFTSRVTARWIGAMCLPEDEP